MGVLSLCHLREQSHSLQQILSKLASTLLRRKRSLVSSNLHFGRSCPKANPQLNTFVSGAVLATAVNIHIDRALATFWPKEFQKSPSEDICPHSCPKWPIYEVCFQFSTLQIQELIFNVYPDNPPQWDHLSLFYKVEDNVSSVPSVTLE